MSIIYLVGAGPGDSKLITLRGLELIKLADCIIYDYLVNPDLLKFRKSDCKLIYVGKKSGAHTLSQDGINQLLVKEARTHLKVVRLKGGDPFIFGRGAEEAIYLKKHKINFEIVPGVTSAIAVPAYAGIPLTERSKNSAVSFITGNEDPLKPDSRIDWQALAKTSETLVFLMGVSNLELIVGQLIRFGKPKNTPSAVIMRGTTPKQKTVAGTLSNIVELCKKNKIFSPAIIVVGEVVGLRSELNWFEKKPFFGKRVIVTRSREQASVLSEKLTGLGAEVLEVPTIRIVSKNADRELTGAMLSNKAESEKAPHKYDWVFFTSQNGVDEFAAFLARAGLDSRVFGKSKICAIGTETAKRLLSIGIRPDYIPKEFVAEAVVRHFKNVCVGQKENLSALILRAKKARDVLPEGLKAAGFKVKIIDLYDTVIPKDGVLSLKEALKQKIDYITFTSSSTVENFVKLAGKNYRRKLRGVKLASIGPVTSSTLKKFGLKADAEAKVYTIEGLVDALTR